MLRARYLNSLVGKPERGWWRSPFSVWRRKRTQRRPFSVTGMVGDDAFVSDVQDVELAQVSTRDLEFVRVVVNVTEISEEGIFRHVITFL